MNQTIDYKKLAYQIGVVFSELLMIVGGIFTITALMAMEKNGTNLEYHYLNSYDYNLMMLKTYGIAMMIGGFFSYIVNKVMALKKALAENNKMTEEPSV